MKLEPGASVTPNVKLVRPLGEGGMGAVWVAHHQALDTEVAVKFLQGIFATDAKARARFSQEAAAAAQVKSSHVVRIYDYGITDTNVPFIVMEMLEGTDLSKRLESEKTISPAALVTIIAQLCKALDRAHEKNVVHRDVKPENVFLTQEGGELFVKLLDFGVAKTAQTSALSTRRSTVAGESLGTPYYMSPEQFKDSKAIDFRTDLWSVGVLAYEALTGVLPFVAETVGALAIVVNDAAPVPPSHVNTNLPAAFDVWFAKACARDPNQRFASARQLADALALALGTMPTANAIESGSFRHIVVSHVDPYEKLPNIALAATSAGTPPARGRARWFIGGGVALACAITIAFVAKAPASHEIAPLPATASASVLVNASASGVATASIAPLEEPTNGASAASAAVKLAPTKTIHAAASPSASPSASAKGKRDRDIW